MSFLTSQERREGNVLSIRFSTLSPVRGRGRWKLLEELSVDWGKLIEYSLWQKSAALMR